MPKTEENARNHERWAHFRFSVVGHLLAAPPARGELKVALAELAAQEWRHPISGERVRYAVSTIERWYYKALRAKADPVGALARRIREDHGTHPSFNDQLATALRKQYEAHKSWSYRLHADNLAATVEEHPDWGPMPSYDSVVRYLKAHGMVKRPRRGPAHRPAGAVAAEARFERREVRSYESEYVNALWHLDFHSGSLRVLMPDGEWVYPHLLGILDDHSRLGCHAQWYVRETAENLAHGVSQAFQKRGLPRALMTDNGSAMLAAETQQGLQRLGILHEKTLPYSPYQNGKQEAFWGPVEGRLLAMLEGCTDLTLAKLNEVTLAWLELDYNRRRHLELGQRPLERYLQGRDVGRPSPSSEELRRAFTAELTRAQRRSDGTITLDGTRFEIPSRYDTLERVHVRFASWDLRHVYLCDGHTGRVLCRVYPQDRHRNAEALRRRRVREHPSEEKHQVATEAPQDPPESGMAPLLRKLLEEYAATGLPPAYLPKDESGHDSRTDPKEASQ